MPEVGHEVGQGRWADVAKQDRIVSTTICHPGFLEFLEPHLKSVAAAIDCAGVPIPVCVLLSYAEREDDRRFAEAVVAGLPNKVDVRWEVTKRRLTCAEARNRVRSLADDAWVAFFDVDVVLDGTYFTSLLKAIAALRTESTVVALAGGIGASEATRVGYLEYLMDVQSYYGKVGDGGMGSRYADLDALGSKDCLYASALPSYSLQECRYRQGFNHVIHTTAFERVSYDDRFFGAEDRDMAAALLGAGYSVRFVPECRVHHVYRFTFWDVCRRKYGHGYYSSMFRHKHRALGRYDRGWLVWAKYTCLLFRPPVSFRSPRRWSYYLLAYATFGVGTVMAVVHRLVRHGFRLRFDYSRYSFRRRS